MLGIKSTRPHAFSQEDAELFEQVAKQVAIAVENALAYNEIETLKNKLEKEKLYLEEEIRSEYNFEEIVGSSPVLKRVLQNVADSRDYRLDRFDLRRNRHGQRADRARDPQLE